MSILARQCPWPLAGLLVGLLTVGLQWADNLPLGATGAAAGFLDWARRPRRRQGQGQSWRALFFIATVLGGFLYAVLTGRFAVSWSSPSGARSLLLVGAGVLIGFGARWAGGCTSGHGICGVGRLQKGSLLATATFVGTAVLTAQIVWGATGR
jgi:uncharacterized membrane protein YedE/YeeE